jgi:hypothetical protein
VKTASAPIRFQPEVPAVRARPIERAALAVALLSAPPLAAQPGPVPGSRIDAPLILFADPEPIIPIRVRDSTLNVRVSPGFDSAVLLNAEPAIATGIKAFPLIGKMRFSSPLLPGGRALFRFNLIGVSVMGGKKRKLPTVWVDPPITARGDGVMSMLAIPGDYIAWDRAGAPAGGQNFILARDGSGDAEVFVRIGGEKIGVSLAPDAPVSIMNARAARALESAGLVTRTQKTGLWEPIPKVRLPYQRLMPAAGATLLGLPLVAPAARVSEAQAKEIDARSQAGTSSTEDDADTIVVTGSREGGRRGRDPWMLIGADVLNQCSRILLDRPGKRWILTCRFEGA